MDSNETDRLEENLDDIAEAQEEASDADEEEASTPAYEEIADVTQIYLNDIGNNALLTPDQDVQRKAEAASQPDALVDAAQPQTSCLVIEPAGKGRQCRRRSAQGQRASVQQTSDHSRQPPATAGRMVTWSPACSGVASPAEKRMSSSFTYRLMKPCTTPPATRPGPIPG